MNNIGPAYTFDKSGPAMKITTIVYVVVSSGVNGYTLKVPSAYGEREEEDLSTALP